MGVLRCGGNEKIKSRTSLKGRLKKEFVPLVGPYILSQEIRLLRSVSNLKQSTGTNNYYELKNNKFEYWQGGYVGKGIQ